MTTSTSCATVLLIGWFIQSSRSVWLTRLIARLKRWSSIRIVMGRSSFSTKRTLMVLRSRRSTCRRRLRHSRSYWKNWRMRKMTMIRNHNRNRSPISRVVGISPEIDHNRDLILSHVRKFIQRVELLTWRLSNHLGYLQFATRRNVRCSL